MNKLSISITMDDVLYNGQNMKSADLKQNSPEDNPTENTSALKPKKPKKRYDPTIISAWCKGCGICIAFCPKKVIANNDMGMPVIEKPDQCIGCRFCELHCPDFAIAIKESPSDHQGDTLL
jgi:2-oxoglutarate ferredoxin oxidoreductase subunit delta